MTPAGLLAGRLVVLTGAGISTDSGIPDYRGPRPAGVAPVRMPMTYQEFVADPAAQQRYWARAHLGWSRMRSAEPNDGHRLLTTIDPDLVITQNVDGLHERAGQRDLVALHGRIAEVICLDCREVTSRESATATMSADNPDWLRRHTDLPARPDGDVDLDDTTDFVVPTCRTCGGRLKPHVVFFGENVPKERVLRSQEAVERSDALLVLGSSLSVMSGLRFVRQAAKAGIPVVIVNRGATRGDDLATHKLDVGCADFLRELAAQRQPSARTAIVGSSAVSSATTASGNAVSTSITA